MWCESMVKGNKSALIHYQFLLLLFVRFAVSYTVFPGIPYPGLFQQYSPVPRASIEHNGCNTRAFDQGEMGLHKLPWNLTRWYFIVSIQMSPEILRHTESKFLVINFSSPTNFYTQILNWQLLSHSCICWSVCFKFILHIPPRFEVAIEWNVFISFVEQFTI